MEWSWSPRIGSKADNLRPIYRVKVPCDEPTVVIRIPDPRAWSVCEEYVSEKSANADMVATMSAIRISEAATLLGVSDDTVRRWIAAGELPPPAVRGRHHRRRCRAAEIARRRAQQPADDGSGVLRSARNRFTGLVTDVQTDTVMAKVTMQCGPFEVTSLMSSEAARGGTGAGQRRHGSGQSDDGDRRSQRRTTMKKLGGSIGVAALLVVAGCSSDDGDDAASSSAASGPVTLNVYAAASLKNTFTAIAGEFEERTTASRCRCRSTDRRRWSTRSNRARPPMCSPPQTRRTWKSSATRPPTRRSSPPTRSSSSPPRKSERYCVLC